MPQQALPGLRILDLSDSIAGAYCTRLLADLGAEVILVEPPDGHPLRRTGPFPGDVPHPEKSGLFLHFCANKRSVVLDLAAPEGRARVRALAAEGRPRGREPPAVDACAGGGWIPRRSWR